MKKCTPREHLFPVFIALLLTCLCTGCGSGGAGAVGLQSRQTYGFGLAVLPQTYVDGSTAGKLTLEITDRPTTVEVSVRVAAARQLKACYLELTYDPSNCDPLSVKSTGLLARPADTTEVPKAEEQTAGTPSSLELAVLSQPGIVHFGEVLTHYQDQPGFTGDGVLVTAQFARRPFTLRTGSVPPTDDASQPDVQWDSFSGALVWNYYCTGDYDQNSEVGVTDLTPLGANFGAAGPFDPQSALAVIDGDGNGELNVADITSIGANFARRVQGYDIYVGPDQDSLPASNDAPSSIDPVGFVPFEQHQGNPQGERLRFAFVYPEPHPDQIVWVRPLDGEATGTPSTPQGSSYCLWQLRNASAFATVEASLNYCSLAVIAGLPAVLYEDLDEQQLVYQQALDPTGLVWGSQVVVADSANLHFASSLVEVAGRPAVCHHDSAGGLYYQRALDTAGSSWGEPQLLADTGGMGWDSHLFLVDGNPAICFQDLAAERLKYLRASEPDGSTWDAPQAIAPLGSTETEAGSFSSPAIIAGHPAVAFYHAGSGTLRFVRALDPLGEGWDDAVVLASGADVGRYASLAEVDGMAAISYRDDNGLAYIKATNAEGTGWEAPVAVDTRFGPVAHLDTCLAVVHGRPAISYYSGADTADLLYTRALDPLGQLWATAQAIDSKDDVGRSTRLVMVGDSPAVSYLDATNRQVKFAICSVGINSPPVARLDASPSQAEVMEEVTFDASRSYDPEGSLELIEWDLDGDGVFEDNANPEPVRMLAFDLPGLYRVAVRVTDSPGLQTMAEVQVIIGDLGQAPQAELTASPLDAAIGEAVHFDAGDSTDPDGTIEAYAWDLDGDGDFEIDTGLIPEIDYEYSEEGDFNAAVRVTDNSGLFDIDAVCINVGLLNQRPVAILTANPTFANPPYTVSLDGSQSYDPDGSIVRYEWDLDGDGIFELDGGATATLSWLIETQGDHRIKLRVTDNAGAQGSTWILCSSNQGPVAKIAASPTSGNCPFTVTLDGSASFDSDGNVASWEWDLFDDGKPESSGGGQPGSWQFSMIWSGPVKVRLNLTDDMGATGSAAVTIHGANGWRVRTLDPVGWAGWFNSLAEINGQPAIAYCEYNSSALKYIRATDPLGVNPWNNPIFIGTTADPGYHPYSVSLTLIDGKVPGISFCGSKSGDPSYVVAKDGQGTQWNSFVTAAPGGMGPGQWLLEVASKPAIATHMLGICFIPAENDLGSKWKSPISVANTSTIYGNECVMAVVNGNPAICFPDTVTQEGNQVGVLQYVRATQPDGSQWGTPVTIYNKDGPGGARLAVIDGRPAVAFVISPSYFEVRYKRAADQNGSSWSGGSYLIKKDGREVLGLVTINGKPAIGLVTCTGHDVMYFEANDAVGSSWQAGVVVDPTDKNLGWGSMGGGMVSLTDHPAMSYYHSVDSALKYAVKE